MAAIDDPLVPVMHEKAPGWPKNATGSPAAYVPLSTALTAAIDWDAFFCAYSVPVIPRRLAMNEKREGSGTTIWDVVPAGGIPVQLFVVDVEPEGHDHPLTTACWAAEQVKLARLLAAHPGGFIYTTRHGYRVVYRLSAPFLIHAPLDSDRWKASYRAWLDYLVRAFGVTGDDACQDWTRLYRLPYVTRDGEPQRPATIGNPHSVGTWTAVVEVPEVRPRPARVEVDEPTWDQTGPIYLDEYRQRLRDYAARRRRAVDPKGHEKAALVDRILAGEPLTTSVGLAGRGRHNTVHRAAQILGCVLPDAGPEAAAELLRPSIEAIGNLAPRGLDFYLEKVKADYVEGARFRAEQDERERLEWERIARAAGRLP